MSPSDLPAEVVSESEAANAPSYESRDPDAPVVMTGSKELSLKLKVCPLANGSLRVTLPCGTTRMIHRREEKMGAPTYHPEGCYDFGREERFTELRNALTRVARFCKVELSPLSRSEAEVLALAKEAEGDRDACCKILRMLLRERTGREWSVKGCRGTSASWVRISAPPRRCGEFAEMSVEDQLLLNAALGEWNHTSLSIRPCGGVRGAFVFRAAGLEVPASWRINERSWD